MVQQIKERSNVAKAKGSKSSLKQLAEANCNKLKNEGHFLPSVADYNKSNNNYCSLL